jgi:hypothetical protein
MTRGVDDRLSGLTPETGEAALRSSEVLTEHKRATSELYFVECRRQTIDTTDPRRFETREVTLIYLSFTNCDISIALPSCGVTLEGGPDGS